LEQFFGPFPRLSQCRPGDAGLQKGIDKADFNEIQKAKRQVMPDGFPLPRSERSVVLSHFAEEAAFGIARRFCIGRCLKKFLMNMTIPRPDPVHRLLEGNLIVQCVGEVLL